MAQLSPGASANRVCRMLRSQRLSKLSDQELLTSFVDHKDHSALDALVERHGRLVFRICRQVLSDAHLAEDAFQATFLVFIQRASSIRRRAQIVNWLCGVAYRVSRQAKRRKNLCTQREREKMPRQADSALDEISGRELSAVISDEVDRLPANLRTAFLLCYVEECTRDQAAVRLGWSVRTLQRRLGEAKKLLRSRLARRGVTLGAVLLTGVLGNAQPSGLLVSSTFRLLGTFASAGLDAVRQQFPRVVTLSQGVLHAMNVAKWTLHSVQGLICAAALIAVGLMTTFHLPGAAKATHSKEPEKLKTVQKIRGGKDSVGDPLPRKALTRIGTTRLRHGHTVTGVAFTQDGTHVASVSLEYNLRVWDVATGRRKYERKHKSSLYALATSPDGQYLATAGKVVTLFNQAGVPLVKLTRPEEDFYSLCFSPDSDRLVAGSRKGKIFLWDLATGKLVFETAHSSAITGIAISPNGRFLAAAGSNGVVQYYAPSNGKRLTAHQISKSGIHAAAFSSDSAILALAGGDGKVYLQQPTTRKVIATLDVCDTAIRALAFSPISKRLVTGNDTGDLQIWNVATHKQEQKLIGHLESVRSIAFSRDGKKLVSGGSDNRVRVWDLATGKEMHDYPGHNASVRDVTYSANAKLLATASEDGTIRLWRASDYKMVKSINNGEPVYALDFHPDGNELVSAGEGNEIRIWSVPAGQKEAVLLSQSNSVSDVAYSPNGNYVASCGTNGAVLLYDRRTKQVLRRITDLRDSFFHSVSFARDGKTLIAASRIKGIPITIWEVPSGQKLHTIPFPNNGIFTIAVSPDGRTFATRALNGDTQIWELATRQMRYEFKASFKSNYQLNSLTYSPSGRYLVLPEGNRVTHVRHTLTGEEVFKFRGHVGAYRGLSFSPDGRHLATGSTDSTVLIWNLEKLRDAKKPSSPLPAATMEKLWHDLMQEDAAQAYVAMRTFATVPAQATELFAERITPTSPVDFKVFSKLVDELGSRQFATRKAASKQLTEIGEAVVPLLQKTLKSKKLVLETRRRVQKILGDLEPTSITGHHLRRLRVLEWLEHVGRPEAEHLLGRLAAGAESWQTFEARRALARLKKFQK